MAIACLDIPHFALRVALLDRPDLDGAPLVLASPSSARPVVIDVTPEAHRRGVRPGMPLREVTAICPEAAFIPPNPIREAEVFDALLDLLETISPLVEPAAPGRAFVDLHGLDRRVGPPQAAADLLVRTAPPELRPRAGVGPGKFTASLAARRARPGASLVVEPSAVAGFLAPLPAAWLPLAPETLRRFERLGLRTIGEVGALPLPALQARFGAEGKLAWTLAHGKDDARVVPRPRDTVVTVALTFPAPVATREMVLIGLDQLVVRAFAHPDLRGRQARQARIRVHIEDQRSWEKELTLREPSGQDRLATALRLRLQDLELPGPAEAMSLDLRGIVGEVAQQQLLPGLRRRRMRPLVEAARHLKQRYGASPLYRIAEVEPWSRIPERRHALITFDP
jgi:protein ImuB